MSLRAQFRLMVAVAAVGLLTLAGFLIKNLRSTMLSERIEKTKNLVDVPYSIMTEQYRLALEGKVTQDAAQKRAIELISGMRYDQGNYFWINDEHPTMLVHPLNPQLNGKDLTEVKDPTGKAIFVEFVKAAKNPEGGFVRYSWPKLGANSDEPVPKLSYVRRFEPWGWIVGTGIYIDDLDASWGKNALTASGIALLCLVPLMVVSTTTYRSIFRRLDEMVDRMKDVAQGEGDLTKRLDTHTNDEIGEVSSWFNTFLDRLQDILTQVASNACSLASAGRELAESSRQQSGGAERQKSQTDQVATAVQQMASTVQQVSENSNSAATASQKASETAREGGKIVEETLSRMRSIAESVRGSAAQVQELGKRSDQIGQIIAVIDEIADQTNLLALNAAIEAARAGEQGRGFAVVADEVRKLAERTSSATKEIASMIRTIQGETRNAVTAMEAGTKDVELGVASTTQAGSALQQIISTNEHVSEMITQIAAAATEQAAATEEIHGSIDQIASITGRGAIAMQQTKTALEDLTVLATNLQRLVGRFRLSSGDLSDCERIAHLKRTGRDAQLSRSIDFARVKMAHRSWRLRLRRFLDGSEDIDAGKLGSHRDCELGKWIYAEALPNYGHLSNVQNLEQKHQQMHALVAQVVKAKHSGQSELAEQQFAAVSSAAEEVIAVLDRVQRQLSESAPQAMAAASA